MTSISAENATLGGLMLSSSKWDEINRILSPDDFSTKDNKNLFKAIAEKMSKGDPIDVVTLSESKNINLADTAFLAKNTPSAANVVFYAQEVKKQSDKRQFIASIKATLNNVNNDSKEPEEALDQLIAEYKAKGIGRNGNKFAFKPLAGMQLKPIDWLIKDFMESDSLIELFGAPESGKSLLAIDWALCIASGSWWVNNKVNPGAVFYIAGEGHNGLSRRFKAWGIDNNIDLDDLCFYTSERAASLCSKESAKDVELAIASIIESTGKNPRLVMIDTLARNFGGGNENSTEDMGQFVSHIDEHIRARFNTTVLLVHHTGHATDSRGRGSSSLKAAVDTEYCMKKDNDGIINLSCTKMKDAAHPASRSFEIKPVDLLLADEDGQPINGVVLQEIDYVKPSKQNTKQLGKNQTLLLAALDKLIKEHREEFIQRGKDPDDSKVSIDLWKSESGLEKQRFNESKNGLLDRGIISIEIGGFVALNNNDFSNE